MFTAEQKFNILALIYIYIYLGWLTGPKHIVTHGVDGGDVVWSDVAVVYG